MTFDSSQLTGRCLRSRDICFVSLYFLLLLFLACSSLANESWKVVIVVGITDKIIQCFYSRAAE